jgi:hypothetical protein
LLPFLFSSNTLFTQKSSILAQPIIIAEILGGALHGLYSNTECSIFIIDRDKTESGGPLITGPFSPTLDVPDLSKAFPDDPEITPELLGQPPQSPYF